MMEKAHARKGHGYAILVAGIDDIVVAHRPTGLCYILYAALMGTLDIIAEGEEGVAAQGHTAVLGYPGPLLLGREHLRALCEELPPGAIAQYIVVLI